MDQVLIKKGFITAGIANIGGVLLFSRGFTNDVINQVDPVVMSNFGMVMIVVWGLAYIAAATLQTNLRWLSGVFAIEKLVYVVMWGLWLSDNSLEAVYSRDLFAGVFYTIYGLNDLLFMLLFAWVFFRSSQRTAQAAA